MQRPTIQVFVRWRPKFGPQQKASGHPGQVRRAKRKRELRAEQQQTRPQDVTAWQKLRQKLFEEVKDLMRWDNKRAITQAPTMPTVERRSFGYVDCPGPRCDQSIYVGYMAQKGQCPVCETKFKIA